MPHEAAKLVSTECAIAETDIRGNFRGVVVLRAPGGDVERAIELARTVLMPNRTVRSSAGITRNKQQAGAPKWVQRPDMSGRGLTCKGAKTVHFRMGFYEAAGLL